MLLVSTVGLAPAQSATVSAQKTYLLGILNVASSNYVAARAYVPVLARADALVLKSAIDRGLSSLFSIKASITAATTQALVDSASARLGPEAVRADTVRTSGNQLVSLRNLRSVQQGVSTTALADLLDGRIDAATFQAAENRASAFSTVVAADLKRQRSVIGDAVAAPALQAPAYRAALLTGTGTIPVIQGWAGFPGGCALPTAGAEYIPRLPAVGPGVATTSAMIAQAKAGLSTDPDAAAASAQLLRASAAESLKVLTPAELSANYVLRTQRLGYGWLTGGDVAAKNALTTDLQEILTAGPAGMDSMNSSHRLMAAASAADWVKSTAMDDTAYIRWIGPQTCLYQDRETTVYGPTNLVSIHNAASFVAAAVFLKRYPVQAGALAKEALTAVQPALAMLTTDGGTQEGPGYWTYQSRAVAVLYSTFANAYVSLPIQMPSLATVSGYALNSTSPDERPTPFGDAVPNELSPFMPAWDAYQRNDAGVAAWVNARMKAKPEAYFLWWRVKPGVQPAKKSSVYPHTGFAALQLPGSTATIKGGSNALTHSHRDLGTVSFYRRGVQWAIDPGTMPNTTPGYYSALQRYTYWKPSTSAHSTIAFDGVNQLSTAVAPIEALSASSVAVDLRQALPGTSMATRTVTQSTTSMLIRDEVKSTASRTMTWQWITDASVSPGVNRAILRKDGQSVTIVLTGVPAGSTLTADAAPDSGPAGQPLTVIKLSMPNINSLSLTATVF